MFFDEHLPPHFEQVFLRSLNHFQIRNSAEASIIHDMAWWRLKPPIYPFSSMNTFPIAAQMVVIEQTASTFPRKNPPTCFAESDGNCSCERFR